MCIGADDGRVGAWMMIALGLGSSRRRLAAGAGLLALAAACRIYRNDGSSDVADTQESPAPSAGLGVARREAEGTLKPGANDALNLWVLNRPRDDLPPVVGERLEGERRTRIAEQPGVTVLVALGLGEGAPCAEQLAQGAVGALVSGANPLDVVTDVLESARRYRWPSDVAALSATVKGSRGALGGVQLVRAVELTSALRHAVSHRAVIDGTMARWRSRATPPALAQHTSSRASRPPSVPALPEPTREVSGACTAGTGSALAGPSGILLRTEGSELFGGVVSAALPADAGVVSITAQYGVSLAVGPAGGVLLVSDCAVPPDERIAERIYAHSSWARTTAELPPATGCRAANALLTRTRAWMTSGADAAWASAEAEPLEHSASGPPDAGVQPERVLP